MTAVAALAAVLVAIGHPAAHRTAAAVEHGAALATIGTADSLPALAAQHRPAERPVVGGNLPHPEAAAPPQLGSKPAREGVPSLSRPASSRPGIRAPPA